MSDPQKNCYNCDSEISVYASTCPSCGASFDPQPRPKAAPKAAPKAEAKPKNIRVWLAEIGMSSYIDVFEENGVTADMVTDLSDSDLQSIGVTKLGHRKTILKAAEAARPPAPAPASTPRPPAAPRRSSHYNYESDASSQSRAAYIVLGLFLGGFGVHNFYAGYTGKGIAQLCIAILLGWLIVPLPFLGLWVLIEVCTVTHDAKGARLS